MKVNPLKKDNHMKINPLIFGEIKKTTWKQPGKKTTYVLRLGFQVLLSELKNTTFSTILLPGKK